MNYWTHGDNKQYTYHCFVVTLDDMVSVLAIV